MVAHGVTVVANGGGRLSGDQLMLFGPETCGGKSGGKVEADFHRPLQGAAVRLHR